MVGKCFAHTVHILLQKQCQGIGYYRVRNIFLKISFNINQNIQEPEPQCHQFQHLDLMREVSVKTPQENSHYSPHLLCMQILCWSCSILLTVIFMRADQHLLMCFRNTAVAEAEQPWHAHSPAANSGHSSAKDISVLRPICPQSTPPFWLWEFLQQGSAERCPAQRALHGDSLGLRRSAWTLFPCSCFSVIIKMSAQNCMAEFQFDFSSVEDDCGFLKVQLISKQPRKSKCN